jgi:hypothetical protein
MGDGRGRTLLVGTVRRVRRATVTTVGLICDLVVCRRSGVLAVKSGAQQLRRTQQFSAASSAIF